MVVPPPISTPRLLLRPYAFGDVGDVHSYCDDPVWGRFLPLPQPYSLRDSEEWIAACVLANADEDCRWAIEHAGRCSGGMSLRIDAAAGIAEIGYSIARRLWGQGLVAEAATVVLGHAFDVLQLQRVWATADAENTQSWRVMEKLGMQREGLLRRHVLHRGELRDQVRYGILRDEWQASNAVQPPRR